MPLVSRILAVFAASVALGLAQEAGRPASAVTEWLGDLLTRMESAPPARRRARRRAS